LRGLRQTHEINLLEWLSVEAVDIVHVRYTDAKDQRTFTALITARARDYYIDDRTREFLRGDTAPARFQEFWTFQLVDGAFRLREIEQTRESDALTTENFFEQFTDLGRDQIYGEAAGTSGPAGPVLPPEVQIKTQKIGRLLNFLVKTDPIWNREEMVATVRRVFLNVLLGWQDGSPGAFTGTPLAPALLERLRSVNTANRQNGWKIEYRNLCIRKVEIVHLNNRDDRQLDAFTVRLNAHAQVIITQAGRDVRRDEWVKPWTEFWTFGRDGNRWALREILPEAKGEAALGSENVDEGTSAQMLEWYYSKTRAT
jgi:predicted lipid-binding transport protein (Tim44 family)